MKTKVKRKARLNNSSATPSTKRNKERTLNEDEQRTITNVEADKEVVEEQKEKEINDDQPIYAEGKEEDDEEGDLSKRRRIEELNNDEAIY